MLPLDRNEHAPSAAELANYFDGELNCTEAIRVDVWLTNHPALRSALEAHADITRLYQAEVLPEPGESEWNESFQRIDAALSAPACIPMRSPSVARDGAWGRKLGWTAAAAAVILFAFLNVRPPVSSDLMASTSLPVAEADDVEILSVHGQDAGMLVVGVVPLQEPLALASARDVTVESVQPDTDGMVPRLEELPADSASPMIVAPTHESDVPARTP